jgi:hypothetical protein
MDGGWASWIVTAFGAYLLVGVLFALAFVSVGAARIDPGARGAPLTFRLLILPAAAALWPLLARRWLSGQTEPPVERNAHRSA